MTASTDSPRALVDTKIRIFRKAWRDELVPTSAGGNPQSASRPRLEVAPSEPCPHGHGHLEHSPPTVD
jgi:hypothetical protein